MNLQLVLHTDPAVPLEAGVICPDKLAGLNDKQVSQSLVHHGNEQATVGDFFTVSSGGPEGLYVEGDLSRVKHIGADMGRGHIQIRGDVGAHLGAGMSGGGIHVDGNAADWVGPQMSGGRIVITGNAGHMVGSAYRGSRVGIQGGEILVHGNVGNETGNTMRRGLIAVGGDSGDFTGVNMLAGSIFVLGKLGMRSGASMKRGSIISMHEAQMLPTFSYAGENHPLYLRHYLLYLRELGLTIDDDQIRASYHRWSGDSVELNKGEILLKVG
ncbi:MAG: formylmethanofuran dehydrogenase subunit C [Gammaproteobacteria bacterium]